MVPYFSMYGMVDNSANTVDGGASAYWYGTVVGGGSKIGALEGAGYAGGVAQSTSLAKVATGSTSKIPGAVFNAGTCARTIARVAGKVLGGAATAASALATYANKKASDACACYN